MLKRVAWITTFVFLFAASTGCTEITYKNDASGAQFTSAQSLLAKGVEDILAQVPDCDSQDNVECMILMDSFERQDPEADTALGFGWSQIIDDVLGRNGERVTAGIYNQNDMGPTPDAITDVADENRALWYSGRRGGSVHSIYMISKPLDLSDYNSVMIAFNYLTADLEVWNWKGESDIENIRLEVCQGSKDDCGWGIDDPSKEALNSDAWVTYYTSEGNQIDGLNGHNHSLDQWKDGFANIDLNQLGTAAKSEFVFRIAVTIDEGFDQHVDDKTPVISSDMEDGVALDNVVALASKAVVEDSGPDDNNGSSL